MHALTRMELSETREQLNTLHVFHAQNAVLSQDSLDGRLAAAQRRLQLAKAKAHTMSTTLPSYISEQPCLPTSTTSTQQQYHTAASNVQPVYHNESVQLHPPRHTHKTSNVQPTLPVDPSVASMTQITHQIPLLGHQDKPWLSMQESSLDKEPSLQDMLKQQQELCTTTQESIPSFRGKQQARDQSPPLNQSGAPVIPQQLSASDIYNAKQQRLKQATDETLAETEMLISSIQHLAKQGCIQQQAASLAYSEQQSNLPRKKHIDSLPQRDITRPPAYHQDDLYVRHVQAAQSLEEAAVRDCDLERLNKQLAELSDHVVVAQTTAQELSIDKKALIAERTALIVYIQGLEAVLLHHSPTSHEDDIQKELQEQQYVCAVSKQRFVEAVAGLPDTSSVKPLLASSELLHVLEGMHARVAKTDKLWRVQLSELEEQYKQEQQHRRETEQELKACRQEMTRLSLQASASQAAIEQLQSDHREQLRKSDQQLMEATKQLASARDRLQDHSRQACNEVYELQQQLLASESGVIELEQRIQRMTTEAEAAQLSAQIELQQQSVSLQNKHAQEVRVLQDTHATVVSDVQKELAASLVQSQAAVSRLEALESSCQQDKEQWQAQLTKAASMNDQLSQQLAAVREEKLQLQVILQQAEQQLKCMRQDLERVRQQHGSLRTQIDKAKQCEHQEMMQSQAWAQEQDERLRIEQAALQALQTARRDNMVGHRSPTRAKSVPPSQRNPTRSTLHGCMPGQLHSHRQVEAQRPRSRASLYGPGARHTAKCRVERPRSPDIWIPPGDPHWH